MSTTATLGVNSSQFAEELGDLTAKQKTFLQMDENELLKELTEANKHLSEWAEYFRKQDRYLFICALKAGYALQMLKEKHSKDRDWVAFAEKRLSDMSQSTIYRYLRLAKQYPDPSKVPTDLGIMQAYRKSGILPKIAAKRKRELRQPRQRQETISHSGNPSACFTILITKIDELIECVRETSDKRSDLAAEVAAMIRQLQERHRRLTLSIVAKGLEKTPTYATGRPPQPPRDPA